MRRTSNRTRNRWTSFTAGGTAFVFSRCEPTVRDTIHPRPVHAHPARRCRRYPQRCVASHLVGRRRPHDRMYASSSPSPSVRRRPGRYPADRSCWRLGRIRISLVVRIRIEGLQRTVIVRIKRPIGAPPWTGSYASSSPSPSALTPDGGRNPSPRGCDSIASTMRRRRCRGCRADRRCRCRRHTRPRRARRQRHRRRHRCPAHHHRRVGIRIQVVRYAVLVVVGVGRVAVSVAVLVDRRRKFAGNAGARGVGLIVTVGIVSFGRVRNPVVLRSSSRQSERPSSSLSTGVIGVPP